MQRPHLQQLFGVDKNNPVFTLWRNQDTSATEIHLYFGTELMEVVPDDRSNPQWKLMIARLYLAGIKPKRITDMFGPARTTIKRWADALVSGDPQRLVQALAGPGPKRKLTEEVRAFVEMRFGQIYAKDRYTYSRQIRTEIRQVFRREISSETLRPLLGRLKAQLNDKNPDESSEKSTPERANTCDSFGPDQDQASVNKPDNDRMAPDNRKNSITFYQAQSPATPLFCHHAGILIFCSILTQLRRSLDQKARMIQQWIASLLSGAVNIEQTKILDFKSLQRLLGGPVIASVYPQRTYLDTLANQQTLTTLFRCNAELIHAQEATDFYYDPHTKHYTGAQIILKGWCPKAKGIGKVMHMDFIHTHQGHPLFIQHADNFDDLRERFSRTVKDFRHMMGWADTQDLTFVIDRGIFKIDLFSQLRDKHHVHIVTWEKGYKESQWDSSQKSGQFILRKPKNSSTHLKDYCFQYCDRPWSKDTSIRQIIVKATNPKSRTIEVAVLASDPQRDARWIITSIFSRWLQENDFKYLDTHFGINQITSYAVLSYKKLRGLVEDRQVKSGKLKALEKSRDMLKQQLGRLLVNQCIQTRQGSAQQAKIDELKSQLTEIIIQIQANRDEVSRFEELIDNEYSRLDTRRKSLMDVIKITTRNMFYTRLYPFRKLYDNFRDDHVILRNLSRSVGFVLFGRQTVEVTLLPTMQYPAALRIHIQRFLDQLNAEKPLMPDDSGRVIVLKLNAPAGKVFSIQNTS
jgi:transposase